MRTLVADRPAGPAAPAFAVWPVASAVVVLGVVLTLTAQGYGYHRDELYFLTLRPAWGYVDQPAFTPWLARAITDAFGDTPAVLRIPATFSHLTGIVLSALIARELSGTAAAQALAAWGYATAALPLAFGHTLLTSSWDLVVWLAVLLAVIGALRRAAAPDAGRSGPWWLAAGVVAGLGLHNKLLVSSLLAALLVGLLVAGRRVLASPWPWAGTGVALLVGLPPLLYQATHDWPQLAMGAALAENNAADVRTEMWWFQLLAMGPLLTPVWLAGLVALWRSRALRPVAVAYPVLLAFTWFAGSQAYYALGLVAVLFTAGCVAVTAWAARSRWRQVLVVAVVVLNGVGSLVIDLPLVPLRDLGATPVPAVNQSVADAVGWPRYVRQIAGVYHDLPAADRADAVIVTANYGEAGAVDRYGPRHGLPGAWSAHNELAGYGPPPDDASAVVAVGDQAYWSRQLTGCDVRARLDNGVGVDNEEQGVPVMVCDPPAGGWAGIWPALRHLD